jgi:hypothetical protein
MLQAVATDATNVASISRSSASALLPAKADFGI